MKDLEKFKDLGEILSKPQMKKILGGYVSGGCYTCGSDGCTKTTGTGWTNCSSNEYGTCFMSGAECNS